MNEVKAAGTDPAVTAATEYQVLAKKMENRPMENRIRPNQWNEQNKDLYFQSSQKQDRSSEIDPQALVDELEDFAARNNISLAFEVDKSTGRTVIKIMDKETDKVLRQLPPEELLDLAASMEDLAGHILNARA